MRLSVIMGEAMEEYLRDYEEAIQFYSWLDPENSEEVTVEVVGFIGSSRDQQITEEDVGHFIEGKKKKNTVRSTSRDVANLERWLLETKMELRPITLINMYLSMYMISVRKRGGEEYEPSSLTCMLYSIDRYLTDAGYEMNDKPISVLKDPLFKTTRDALKAKRQDLKQQGKGQRPNRARPLTDEEERIMWEKKVLGPETPFSLQFSVFYYLTLTMGLRGRDEHRKMTWGDLVCTKRDGKECLVFKERDTKTRDGATADDTRSTEQIYFCECDTDALKCVVELYKEFRRRRPSSMLSPDRPFYLTLKTPDQVGKGPQKEIWYKNGPMGKNTLSKMLAEACEKADIEIRTNHGMRATCVQRLRKGGVPDDQIIQITGHKSARSLASYDANTLDTDQHERCQSILTRKPTPQPEPQHTRPRELALPTPGGAATYSSATTTEIAANPQSLFGGATFNNCSFHVYTKGEAAVKRRRAVIDSDSD